MPWSRTFLLETDADYDRAYLGQKQLLLTVGIRAGIEICGRLLLAKEYLFFFVSVRDDKRGTVFLGWFDC